MQLRGARMHSSSYPGLTVFTFQRRARNASSGKREDCSGLSRVPRHGAERELSDRHRRNNLNPQGWSGCAEMEARIASISFWASSSSRSRSTAAARRWAYSRKLSETTNP